MSPSLPIVPLPKRTSTLTDHAAGGGSGVASSRRDASRGSAIDRRASIPPGVVAATYPIQAPIAVRQLSNVGPVGQLSRAAVDSGDRTWSPSPGTPAGRAPAETGRAVLAGEVDEPPLRVPDLGAEPVLLGRACDGGKGRVLWKVQHPLSIPMRTVRPLPNGVVPPGARAFEGLPMARRRFGRPLPNG